MEQLDDHFVNEKAPRTGLCAAGNGTLVIVQVGGVVGGAVGGVGCLDIVYVLSTSYILLKLVCIRWMDRKTLELVLIYMSSLK